MNDNELYEILQSYKTALDALIDQNEKQSQEIAQLREELSGRVDTLEKTLYEEILTPAKEAFDKAEYENRFNDFSAKYGEKLAPYADQAKAIEGDEYDLPRAVFDNYDKMEEKPDLDAYVDTVVDAVAAQIDAVKQALGADKVEIKSDKDGEVKIEADGKDVTDKVENMDAGGEGAEPPEPEKGEDEPGEDNPEDIAALEKELESYKG